MRLPSQIWTKYNGFKEEKMSFINTCERQPFKTKSRYCLFGFFYMEDKTRLYKFIIVKLILMNVTNWRYIVADGCFRNNTGECNYNSKQRTPWNTHGYCTYSSCLSEYRSSFPSYRSVMFSIRFQLKVLFYTNFRYIKFDNLNNFFFLDCAWSEFGNLL